MTGKPLCFFEPIRFLHRRNRVAGRDKAVGLKTVLALPFTVIAQQNHYSIVYY